MAKVEVYKSTNDKGNLDLQTYHIYEDERCLDLCELERTPDGSSEKRRFQIITVLRGDLPVKFVRDLGASCQCKADQFWIRTGVVTDNGKLEGLHSVGEATEIADGMRGEKYLYLNLPRTDLLARYKRELDMKGELN